MRVLILTTSFPLTETSSSGVFVARLSKYLAKEHQVTVLTPSDRCEIKSYLSGNIRVVPFRYAPCKWQVLAHAPGGIPVTLKRNPLLYLLVPFFLAGMFTACLKYGRSMDVIHANWSICGVIAGLAGKLCCTPVITTLRGEDMVRASNKIFDRLLLRLCARLSDRLISVSQAIVDLVKKKANVAEHRLLLIENGVDDVFFTIQRNPSLTGKFRLITIGSLIQRKGMNIILQALQLSSADSELHLSIVGEGVEEPALRAIVQGNQLADMVTFTGAVNPSQIPSLLREHDVLVLASYSEGRPNVILEAMAAGIPVIASAIAGVDELVKDGQTGLLFRAGDPFALSQHIENLRTDPDKVEMMGRKGRQLLLQRGLLWQVTADKYTHVYRDVLRSHS